MKYLKVHVEGCHQGCDTDLYTALDSLTAYTSYELERIGQDLVNEYVGGWGAERVDESEVPEGDR